MNGKRRLMLMVLALSLLGATAANAAGEDHAAAEAFANAEQLRKNGDEDAARKAIESYKQAVSAWNKAHNRTEEARSLARIADVYRSFHELKDALAYYDQALALYHNLKDRRGECQTLNQITSVYVSLGENPRARSSNRAAARLARLTNDRALMAQALNNEGEIYYWSGEQKKAIDFYQRALRLWIEAKDLQGQAETYTYLGYSTSDLAQVKDSFDYYRRALELWQSISDHHGEAITFTGLGRLYSRVGESQEALDYLNKANAFLSRSPNPVEKARVLTAFAFVYGRVGEKQKAIDYYQRALALYKSANYLKGQAATLYSAGKVYYSLEDHQKALDSQREALELSRTTGDRRIEILALIEIGRLLDFANDKAGAIRNYLLARSFAQSRNDQRTEMDTWNLLGRVYESQGKQQLALDYHKRALTLSREAKYPFGESETLYRIARMYFALHDLPAARQQIEEAIGLIESLRTKVNSQEFRASYFASVRELYELYIDLLMELHAKEPQSGYDVLAFETSERARARSLLEMLATARVGVREKVDPELLARERALRAELSARAEQSLSFQPASGREGERAAVDRELEDLATRYQEVKAQVRAASLDHTEQTQPRSLGLQEIRDRDLADDTALLEFFLGERRSYLWIVTKNSFKSLSLPPRGEIEESAIALRKLLVPPAAQPGESYDDFQERVREAESEYWRKAAVFSETLLGPVAGDLTATRLLIVPDGALQYISFAALPIPARGDDVKPLMLEHEITLQPSASILAMLRGRAEKPAERAIAVFADPVFELDDSRFQAGPREMLAGNTTRDEQMESALRDVNTWNTGHIPRLLASREEAKAIIDLTSFSTNLKAIDFEANKATFTSLDLSQFRIIHIATHGILDSRHPELSGLLLSRFDKDGRPKEGFLRLDDIYNLSLSAAMVVLSACNTGLGKDVRGEGLVGLVHGFMYAGTSRVVASLWKVDDDATAQLMSYFYREMFQAGKSPAAALRAAQIEMWEQKRWRSPYFWAAFVLHGDYEGRVNDTRRPQVFPWTAAAMAVLVVTAGFFFLKKKLRKKDICPLIPPI